MPHCVLQTASATGNEMPIASILGLHFMLLPCRTVMKYSRKSCQGKAYGDSINWWHSGEHVTRTCEPYQPSRQLFHAHWNHGVTLFTFFSSSSIKANPTVKLSTLEVTLLVSLHPAPPLGDSPLNLLWNGRLL